MNKRNQITEGVIWKQLLLFFFPIVFGTFFQQIYNTADTIVVGRFVGKEALAAVGGSVNQIVNLIVEVFVGLTSGAAVVVSQFFGAQDRKNLDKTVHTSYAFSLAAGVIIGAAEFFLSDAVLKAMNTPAELMADSRTYLHIYFMGIVFNLVYNMGASVLRAMGDSRRPLYVLMSCLYFKYYSGHCSGGGYWNGSSGSCHCHSILSGSQRSSCYGNADEEIMDFSGWK